MFDQGTLLYSEHAAAREHEPTVTAGQRKAAVAIDIQYTPQRTQAQAAKRAQSGLGEPHARLAPAETV